MFLPYESQKMYKQLPFMGSTVTVNDKKSCTYHLAFGLTSVRRRSFVSNRGRRSGESSWSVSSEVVLTDVRGISSGLSTDSRKLLQWRGGRPRHSDPRDFRVSIVDSDVYLATIC